MKPTTLCLLLTENQILLAMKKRGFGMGKWNGVGGKVEIGETVPEAALRELREEIGVTASLENLEEVGSIEFYFTEKPDWNLHMHIFLIRNWKGEPVESEEMKPQWFSFEKIPYDSMWADDPYWLPKVLEGKKIKASFYFNGDGESFDRHEIKEI